MDLPEELASRPPRKTGQEPTATITLEAYGRLRAELNELTSSGRSHMAERLRAAREHGDIRENAEYDSAKNEQALMESRIRNLERMLRDPEIIEAPSISDVVTPGMLVTVRPLDDEDPDDETYLLAESAEERAAGVRTITTTSPLGQALMGARTEEQVSYEAPGGTFRCGVVRRLRRGGGPAARRGPAGGRVPGLGARPDRRHGPLRVPVLVRTGPGTRSRRGPGARHAGHGADGEPRARGGRGCGDPALQGVLPAAGAVRGHDGWAHGAESPGPHARCTRGVGRCHVVAAGVVGAPPAIPSLRGSALAGWAEVGRPPPHHGP